MSAESNCCLNLGKYATASKHGFFSLDRRPSSTVSPSSTPEMSFGCSQDTSFCVLRCVALQHPLKVSFTQPMNQTMFSTALNQGMASIVLAACLTTSELFGQNRVLTSITGNICLLSFDSEGNIFATKR